MKRIRIYGLIALAVICLTVMAGCGRRDDERGTGSSDTQNNANQNENGTDDRNEAEQGSWCTCEADDHTNNGTDNTDHDMNDQHSTGGLMDDIGNGISDAVDDIGNGVSDAVDDIGGEGTREDHTDRDTTENNRMR